MASSSSENTLSWNTVMHMLSNKLTSSNYLLWKNHMTHLLSFQGLLSHVDGSSVCPSATTTVDQKVVPNPDYESWDKDDQKAVLILITSLSDEAAAEVLNISSAREIWVTLEAAYSSSSVERIQNLNDQLRRLTKGTQSVAEFGRRFKDISDRLAAVGHPVAETDKVHWFLTGLGSTFSTFTIAIRAARPDLTYRDAVALAEGHELGLQNAQPAAPVAFNANRGRGNHTTIRRHGNSDAHMAQAFHATNDNPDWYVDSGATDHMASSTSHVAQSYPYFGQSNVTFGNGSGFEAGSRSRSV